MDMPPLNKFTEEAREIIRKAHELAIDRGQNTITPTHLLGAIFSLDQGIIFDLFEKLKLNFNDLYEEVLDILNNFATPVSGSEANSYQLYLNPELIIILQESEKISAEINEKFIGPEHLFLALILNPDTEIQFFIEKFNLDKKKIFENIFKLKGEKPKKKEQKRVRNLERFAKNLTHLARENKLDPVLSREEEIKEAIEVLGRRKKNNLILIGEAGVGKTAIIEGIAQKIIRGDLNEDLNQKEIFALDMGLLVAGTKFRGEFEERLKAIIKEVRESKGKIILFIDEIHSIVGAGASDGSLDASNILKPALARGEINLIGATTIDEYRRKIEKDPALTRRFQAIKIQEPDFEKSVQILQGLKKEYEHFHSVEILDEAIESAIRLSDRYITEKFLPDKAIDLIDQAASVSKISLAKKPLNLLKLENELFFLKFKAQELKNKKTSFTKIKKEISLLEEKLVKEEKKWDKKKKLLEKINQDKKNLLELEKEAERLEMARKIDEFLELKEIKIKALEASLEKKEKQLRRILNQEDIFLKEIGSGEVEKIVAKITGIPVSKLSTTEKEKFAKIDEILGQKIIGQEEAVKKVSAAIKRSRAGLSDPNRPLASFLFSGPTGVGKTALAKELSQILSGNEKSLIKIDMSEFMESHSVSKLIGSPPGYVGYEKGGSLTEKVRRNPYSVILFDEIEKASLDVLNILLQILDEGVLRDSTGIEVNFKNTIIILTSNLGSSKRIEAKKIGFVSENKKKRDNSEKEIKSVIEDYLSQEFLNRLDEIIVFRKLGEKDILKIFELEVEKIKNRLAEKNIFIDYKKNIFKNYIIKNYNFDFGARPVKRILEEKILNPLAEKILEFEDSKINLEISLDKKNELIFKFKKNKKEKVLV